MPCGFLYALEKGQYKYRKKLREQQKTQKAEVKKLWQVTMRMVSTELGEIETAYLSGYFLLLRFYRRLCVTNTVAGGTH